MGDEFHSDGGEQNIAQGQNAIGKQVNTTQETHGDGNISSGTGNVTVNGISPQVFADYVGKLAVTESALASFFRILEQQQVPLNDLDSKLREIAFHYKELLLRSAETGWIGWEEPCCASRISIIDIITPNIIILLAKQIYSLLLYRRYSNFLYRLEYQLNLVARHRNDTLRLYEQNLAISKDIRDKAGEARALNNIGQIHHDIDEYNVALEYIEQSLAIGREIGDKAIEAVTSWNIGLLYKEQGELAKAEPYISRAVELMVQLEHPKLKECREVLELVRATLRGNGNTGHNT